MAKYIYQYENWTTFTWQKADVNLLLGEVRHLQGKLLGQMKTVGFNTQEEASLSALTLDVVSTSEIEGEKLDYAQVRSSIARKLGINIAGLVPSNRNVEGVVEMMLDATRQFQQPLTNKRLFAWHAALFPTGYSGMVKIETGRYRSEEMQIFSRAMSKEKIHYVALPAKEVKAAMNKFLVWFNNSQPIDPVIKSAIAHFWFIIIHPFDDGNGRIARALSDLLLARSEATSERYYSISSQILAERTQYYAVLQSMQHSSGDISEWINWFLHCLKNALLSSEKSLQNIWRKATFWQIHETTALNDRQRYMLNKLLDGLDGKLKSSKWAKMTKCSSDTALRDIKDLIEKGIIQQENEGGRNTNYELRDF